MQDTATEQSVRTVRGLLAAGDVSKAARELVALCLIAETYEPAEAFCLELSGHEDPVIRGNAVLGLGHLARRLSRSSNKARAAVKDALDDPNPYVRGHADSALDDIRSFSPAPPDR